MQSGTVECAGCRKRFNARMGTCPFCGVARDGGVQGPAPGAESPPVPESASELVPGPEAAAPASDSGAADAGASLADELTARLAAVSCGSCGVLGPLSKVRIELWEDLGYTLMGFGNKRKFKVKRIDAPCLCRACALRLQKKRLLADVLTVLPMPLVLLLGMVGKDSGPVAAFIVLGYLIYLARRGTYSWADKMLYGYEMETTLARWVPDGEGRAQFPVGLLRLLFRVALMPVVGVALVVVVFALKTLIAPG